jgi:hypothetical protein
MLVSPLIPILAGSLLALGCLIGAFYNLRHKCIIDDLPTSKAQGVFIGLTELKGTVESEKPFTSFLAGVQCVHYGWQIEEHWQRTVHETYRDAHGHTHTRTRTESGWTRVADGGESGPFYLKDDTGVIRIVPEGASIHANTVYNRTLTPGDTWYYGKGPLHEIANSTHRRRFYENAIPLHTMLYLLGQARERQDIVAAEIALDKQSPIFMISIRSEKQISSGYGRWFWFWLALGWVMAAGSGASWGAFTTLGLGFNWLPIVIMAAGYFVVLLLVWVWTTYNSLINLHHRVKQGWSQVEVQIKRRHDLIPNLVHAIEGYRQYENEAQSVLAEMRGQVEATPPGAAGPDFKGLAPLVRLTIERYPELKASESFLKLQKALVETEQRIALARDYFNDVATFYNTRLEIVPDRFAAALARLHPRVLMSAAEFERAPVKVQLAE